jgi:hypothetical protein
MNNQESDAGKLRKELQNLAYVNRLELGPQARKTLHERMMFVAFKLTACRTLE